MDSCGDGDVHEAISIHLRLWVSAESSLSSHICSMTVIGDDLLGKKNAKNTIKISRGILERPNFIF